MKIPFRSLLSAASISFASGFTSVAQAFDLTWDTVSGDSVVIGGAGNWDTSTANWTTDDGVNNIAWVNANNDTAVFGGTGGAVALQTGITAGGLTFNSDGYTVSGNTITLAGASTVSVANSGQIATIGSVITGGSGFTKTGAGTLVLTGTNSYTGGTAINGGTLQVQGAGATLPSGTAVSLSNGGVLSLAGGATGTVNYSWVAGSAVADSLFNGTFSANSAIDGNGSSYWASANVAGQHWIYADLGTVRSLSQLSTSWFAGPYAPASMKLQVSNDGVNWTDASSVVNTANGASANITMAFNAGTTGRYVRIQETSTLDANSQKYPALYEMTASGTGVAAQTYTIASLSSADMTTSVDLGTAATGNTLVVGDSTSTAFAGMIVGWGNLTKQGSGTLTLTGASTYSGATAVNGGTLQLGDGTAGNDGTLTTSGITVGGTGTLTYNIAGNRSISYAITGAAGATLVKDGAGTLTLNNTGAVNFGSNGSSLKVKAGRLIYTGLATGTGLYQTSIDISSGATLEMNVATGVSNNFGAWAGSYTGTGTLVKSGAGTVDFGGYAAGPRSVNFGAGALIQVSGGTLQGNNTGTGQGVTWTNNQASLQVDVGATFAANNGTIRVDALIGSGNTASVTLGSGSLTVGVAGGGNNFAGVISGTGSFTKTGAGAQLLSGVNTYTGGTTVSGGTLSIGSTGQVVVNATSGINITAGALTVDGKIKLTSGSATIANGTATAITLNASTSVLDIGSFFNSQADGSTYQLITGATKSTTGTFSSIFYDTNVFSSVTFNNANGTLAFTAVPEPSTYGLIGAGVLAAVAFVRRRRRHAGKVA